MIRDIFASPAAGYRRLELGGGRIEDSAAGLRFVTTDATAQAYSDAQLDDYRQPGAPPLLHRPPQRLALRARFSHPAGELRGTAGFGFWNYPFVAYEWRLPRLPRAAWFFYASSPSNLKLDLLTPGYGWKAAVVDTQRPAALATLPLAPLAVALLQVAPLYRALWPIIQVAAGVREAPVPVAITDWHSYELTWDERHVHFSIDGAPLLTAPAPQGPLCFVAWLDNQYMVVTPQGRFGWGLLAAPGQQWMELAPCGTIAHR